MGNGQWKELILWRRKIHDFAVGHFNNKALWSKKPSITSNSNGKTGETRFSSSRNNPFGNLKYKWRDKSVMEMF